MTRVLKLNDIVEQEIGDAAHPVRMRTWDRNNLSLPAGMTHFGFSISGALSVDTPDIQVKLSHGGFFRIEGAGTVNSNFGVVLSVPGKKGFSQVSGPYSGVRLIGYLPGGKQNCLIWPADVSYPTLNTLQMEKHQSQIAHSHDSLRINVIISGSGKCLTPNQTFPLVERDILIIPANKSHQFETKTTGMKFIAFHPDSDGKRWSEILNPMMLETIELPQHSQN